MPTSLPLIVNCAYGAGPDSFFEPHLRGVTRWRHFEAGEPFASALWRRVGETSSIAHREFTKRTPQTRERQMTAIFHSTELVYTTVMATLLARGTTSRAPVAGRMFATTRSAASQPPGSLPWTPPRTMAARPGL